MKEIYTTAFNLLKVENQNTLTPGMEIIYNVFGSVYQGKIQDNVNGDLLVADDSMKDITNQFTVNELDELWKDLNEIYFQVK